LFDRFAAPRISQLILCVPFEFGGLFRREFVGKVVNNSANFLEGFVLFLKRKFAELFYNFGRTHGGNLLLSIH